jgi:hypothetical protein
MKTTVKEIEEYMSGLSGDRPEENSTKGVKYDGKKLRYSLLPLDSLQEVVKVLEFGAKKYAPDNWKYVDDAEARYWDAAMRHIVAYKLEDKADSETGLSHLAHAICCLLFLINFDKSET